MRTTLLAALLVLASTAVAQDAGFRVAHVVVPQRRVFSTRGVAPAIRIDGVRVHVKVIGQTATTTLEVAVSNPGPRAEEAVLLLPVPPKAAVHSFTFLGSAKEPTATLLPAAEARRIYNSIVAKSRDPALLEFAGLNVVRSSVFPVPARGVQKVSLRYDHLLRASDGRVDYVLPRSESLDVRVPWDVTVTIVNKAGIGAVYSPSHELAVKRESRERVSLRLTDPAHAEPGPFRFSYMRAAKDVTASLFTYPDPTIGGGYFLLLASLPGRETGAAAKIKREVTVVLDRSGSMAGPKLDQAKAAALQVIEGLADGEAFNIIDYGTSVATFAAAPVVKNPQSTKKARAYLASLRPRGGTNIYDALVEALTQDARKDMLSLVLFLTDGLPTIGRTSEVDIRQLVEKHNTYGRRVFTFGVGHDVNAPLLDRLAEKSRATSTYVLPQEDVEVKVADVFKRLYGPVLADVVIRTLDAEGNVVTDVVREPIPAVLPDLFEGDQLVLLGQYRGGGALRFKLGGGVAGKLREYRFDFDLKPTTRNAFVPRLWATRRIAFLVDEIRQAGAQPGGRPRVAGNPALREPRLRELVQEIVRLSAEFGILSEYTSFLAREGTDLSNRENLFLLCGTELNDRAVKNRWGQGAVAQALNGISKKSQSKVNPRNGYYDEKLNRVEVTNVQQVCDRSLFKRGNRWIDGRLVARKSKLVPDKTVTFGSREYESLLDDLIKAGRQGVLAFRGEILIRIDGRTVLVRNTFQESK